MDHDELPTYGTGPMMAINEVADRLGVTPRFVRRLVAERRITFHRVGRFIRFRAADVDELLAEGRVERRR